MKKSLILFLPVAAITPLAMTLSCNQTSTNQLDNQQDQINKLPAESEKPNLDLKPVGPNQPDHIPNVKPEVSKPNLPTSKDENIDLDFGVNLPQLPEEATKPEQTNQVIMVPDLEAEDQLIANYNYQVDYHQLQSINDLLEQLNFKDHPILAILNHNVITPNWIFENQQILFGNNLHLNSEKEIAKIMTVEDPTTTKLVISVLTTDDKVVRTELTGFKVDPSLAQTQSQWPFKANKIAAFEGLKQTEAIKLINQNFIINNIDWFLSGTTRFVRAADIINLTIRVEDQFIAIDFDIKEGRAIEGTINNYQPTTKAKHFSTAIDFK